MSGRLLDLFCGVGGAAVGYHRAGFDVVGVDIDPQPDYPFPFVQADALSLSPAYIATFDVVHASPPCQAYSALSKGTNRNNGRTYPDLIAATREMLRASSRRFVLENVQGAPIRRDLLLCGEWFGLSVIRHRYFEFHGYDAPAVEHRPHRGRVRGWRHGVFHEGPYVACYGAGGGKGSVAEWQTALGIDWTDHRKSLAEAIPPAYTELIGHHIR